MKALRRLIERWRGWVVRENLAQGGDRGEGEGVGMQGSFEGGGRGEIGRFQRGF